MKPYAIQKEILLMTGTIFETKRLKKFDNQMNHVTLKKKKQQFFDKSYWSTMLPIILPEIVENKNDLVSDAYISFVRRGRSFIQLEISEEILIIEREYSLDPYLFLSSQIYN